MSKLILILLFLPVLMYGENIVWDREMSSKGIGDRIEILEDATGQLTYEQIISENYQSGFQPNENLILSLGYTESFFWLRFTVDNRTQNQVLLELAQAGLPVAEMYFSVNDSSVQHVLSGYTVPLEEKSFNSSFQVFSLPPGIIQCYLRINSNSEPVPINLCSEKTYVQSSMHQQFFYGIYLGLMLFVALYNLFLFISLRKILYLFYTFIVVIYIGYSAAVIDGFIVYFIPNVNLLFLYTTIPAIGIVLQTIYCLVFLEAKKYTPQIYKWVVGIAIYFGIWMVIKFFLTFPVVQPVNTFNALLSFLTMGFVGVQVGRKGNKLGYYFASAYFIYFILVVLQAVYINTGSPRYLAGLSHVAYATLMEVFFLSFLLSRRFEWEKEEIENDKFEAQIKLLEKQRENERIIQTQNEILEKEVAARTADLQEMNEEFRAANERLIELSDYKESMSAMIVHDFKNLLNTVISFSESTPTKRRLQSIHSAGKYMHNLVMNILDVQKFESVEFDLALGNHPIRKVIKEAIDQMSFLIEQKSINLTINEKEELISRFDYELILRTIVNILSNAIKYVQINGSIDIVSLKQEDDLLLSIKDDGIGIPADKLHLVFDKYTQIEAPKSGAVRSTGLGLAFCKMVIEAHEGKIGVKSEVNVGSEFFFTLPLLNGDAPDSDVIEKINFKEDNTIELTHEERAILSPFLKELRQWEIYDFSDILAISERIEKIENENILTWNNNLTKILYRGDAESYKKIINQ